MYRRLSSSTNLGPAAQRPGGSRLLVITGVKSLFLSATRRPLYDGRLLAFKPLGALLRLIAWGGAWLVTVGRKPRFASQAKTFLESADRSAKGPAAPKLRSIFGSTLLGQAA